MISGIPFFTRLWSETPKTEEELASQAGTDAAEYNMNVDSQALGMTSASDQVAQAGAEITWDDKAQQNYATWTVDNVTYEIWLEDEKSIEPKLQLMKENKLARYGSMGFGTRESRHLESDIKIRKLVK